MLEYFRQNDYGSMHMNGTHIPSTESQVFLGFYYGHRRTFLSRYQIETYYEKYKHLIKPIKTSPLLSIASERKHHATI